MIASLKYNEKVGLEAIEKISDEHSLVNRLKRGDRISQSECYNLYVGKMYSIAMRYTSSKEDAKEVINTAFLKVFNSIQSFQFKGSFEGWIRTIVKRVSIDHCRKYVYNNIPTYEVLEFDAKVYNNAVNNLEALDFLKLVGKIPPASRIVFNLFAIEGYSHKEISKELNISEGTSKWHLSNARKKLINIINSEKTWA